MKLHLPKPLRNSVLACIAAVAGIATPTLGTATFAGGVVAFTLATQQAAAATYLEGDNLYYIGGATQANLNSETITGVTVETPEGGKRTTVIEEIDTNGKSTVNIAADSNQNAWTNAEIGLLKAQAGATIDVRASNWDGNRYFDVLLIEELEVAESGTVNFNVSKAENTVVLNSLDGTLGTAALTGTLTIGFDATFANTNAVSGTGTLTVVNGATVTINTSGGTSGVTSNVQVGAGSKLVLAQGDALGWGTTNTKSITLLGSGTDEAGQAKLEMSGKQTMATNLNLSGNGVVTGGQLEFLGGRITATGTNNVIASDIYCRAGQDGIIEVTGAADVLKITGTVKKGSQGEGPIIKEGEGQLILSGADNIFYKDFAVKGGTVTLSNTTTMNGSLTLHDGATLETTVDSAITFGSNFKIDLSNLTAVAGEGNAMKYTILTGSGNKTLEALNVGSITGVLTAGKSWTFGSDGCITYVVTTKDLVWSGDDLTWNPTGTEFSTGGQFSNWDSVTFTGSSNVTVDASGVIAMSLTVEGEGTLVKLMNGNYITTELGTTIKDGATLELTTKLGWGDKGVVRGELTVEDGGTLRFSGGDVTGYDGGSNSLRIINVEAGGTLELSHNTNETYAGTLNLDGALRGTKEIDGQPVNAIWDMFGGTSTIIVSDGANAVFENVQLRLRQAEGVVSVGEGATLTLMEGVSKNGTNETYAGVLVKRGAGSLVIEGDYTAGDIVLNGGSLEFSSTNDVNVTLTSGSSFVYNGSATVNAGDLRQLGVDAPIVINNGILKFTGADQEDAVNRPGFVKLFDNLVTTGDGKAVVEGNVDFNYRNETAPCCTATLSGALEVTGNLKINSYGSGNSPDGDNMRRWNIESDGTLTVGGALWLTNQQKMVVSGGDLVAAGGIILGHGENGPGGAYKAKLQLDSGSVTTSGIEFKGGHNSVVMNDGTLEFTSAEAFTGGADNNSNQINLLGGTIKISASDVTLAGSAQHNLTMGGIDIDVASGKTATLGGTISLSSTIEKTGSGTLKLDNGLVLSVDNLGTFDRGEGSTYTDFNGSTTSGNGFFSGSILLIAGDYNKAGALTVQVGGTAVTDYVEDSTGLGVSVTDNSTYFVNTGTVTLTESKSVSAFYIASGAVLAYEAGDFTGVVITGSGVYDIGSNYETANRTGVTNADAWTGTVRISNATVGGDKFFFNNYGNVNSALELVGVSGWLPKASNMAARLLLGKDTEAGLNGINVTAASDWTHTFSGGVAGEGDFLVSRTGGGNPDYVFRGDMSGWTGAFRVDNESGNQEVIMKVENTGVDTTVNAGVECVRGNLTLEVAGSNGKAVFNKAVNATTLKINGHGEFTKDVTLSGDLKFTADTNNHVVFHGTNNIVNVIDLSNGNAAAGILELKKDAKLTSRTTLWMRPDASIQLEEGASVIWDDTKITGKAGSVAEIKASANASQWMDTAGLQVKDAMFEVSKNEARTVAALLQNSSIVNSGTALVTVTNAGNTLTGVEAKAGNIVVQNATTGSLVGLGAITAADGLSVSAEVASAQVSAITLGAGSTFSTTGALAVADGSALSLGADAAISMNGALTLGSGLAITVSDVTKDTTLFSGVTSIATSLDDITAYISSINGLTDLSDYTLELDGTDLVLVVDKGKIVNWSASNSIWEDGAQFGATAEDVDKFVNGDAVVFGTLEANEEVTIKGEIHALSMDVAAGADKTYTFSAAANGGTLTVPTLSITSGKAVFGANTIQLDSLAAVTVGQTGELDVSAYGLGAFSKLVTKTTGDGTVKIGSTNEDAGNAGVKVDLTAIEGTTLNLNANYVVSGNMALDGGNTAETVAVMKGLTVGTLRVQNGTILELVGGELSGTIQLGLGRGQVGGAPASEAGHLVIHSGATVAASNIMKVTAQEPGACTITMDGGILKMTAATTITDIATTITGGTLVADTASWGIKGATIGGATVTDGTLSCAVQIQTAGLDTESADDDTTITLTNATLTGTLDNAAGKLELAGVVTINGSGFNKQETLADFSNGGTDGFATTDTYYQLVTTAGNLSIADGTTWNMGEYVATGDKAGWVRVDGTQYGDIYYLNTADTSTTLSAIKSHAGTTYTLNSIALNGGNLEYDVTDAAVAINVQESGVIKITDADTTDTTEVVLSSSQVSGNVLATITGNGVYDIGNTALGSGPVVNAVKVTGLKEAAWSGTVVVKDSVGNANKLGLNELGNANSTVKLVNTQGYLWNGTGSNTLASVDTNVILADSDNDYNAALTIANGSSKSASPDEGYVMSTFTKKVSGTGNMAFSWTAGYTGLAFTGDVSEWTGAFIVTAGNDTGNGHVNLKFSGDANVIKADLKRSAADRQQLMVYLDDAGATDTTAGITMHGSIEATKLTLGLADDTADSRAKVNLNNSVTVDTLANYAATTLAGDQNLTVGTLTNAGTLTVNGTLVDGAAVTNNGTLELTQAAATLASLAGTGSVTAKSLTLTGAATDSNGITADSLTLQGASNTVGALTLTGALTLGANVTSLTAGEMNISGDVVVNKLTAGLITSAGLAGGSSLNLAITEEVLLDYMLTNVTNTLALGQIDGVTLDQLSLNGKGSSFETADGQYTYTLSVDGGSITLNRTNNGQEWEGSEGNNIWGVAGNWSAGTTPGTEDSVKFTGNGSSRVTIAGDVEIGNVTIDIEEGTDTSEYEFLAPADGSSAGRLAITRNMSVNAGTLTIGVSTIVEGRSEVLEGSTLNVMSGDLTSKDGFTNGGTLNISAPAGDTQSAVIVAIGDMVNTGTIMNGGVLGLGYGAQNASDSPNLYNSGTIFNAGTLAADGNLNNTGILYHAGMMRALGNVSNTGENAELSIFGGLTQIAGVLDNDALLTVNDGMVSAGSVDNSGTMNVGGGELTIGAEGAGSDVPSVNNSGALAVTGGSVVINGSVTNAGADTPADMSISGEGTSVNITGALTNADSVTVSGGASLSADSAANTGSIEVTGSTLVLGDATTAADVTTLDNDGNLTVSGSEATIYGSVDNDGSLTVDDNSTMSITGDLNNTNGTITIGSDTTAGTLEVGGDLTGTGGTDKLVVNSGSTLDVRGDLTALEDVELDFDGTVIVGGNVKIGSLVNNGVFMTTNKADNAEVKIGALSGSGELNVDGGKLLVGSQVDFTGTLTGYGELEITGDNGFTLLTKQDTITDTALATDVTASELTITEAANGSILSDVKTDSIIIDKLDTQLGSEHLTVNSLTSKTEGGVVNITITNLGVETLAKGNYDLIALGGAAPKLNLVNNDDVNTDDMQTLLANGLYIELSPAEAAAATFKLTRDADTTVQLVVRDLTLDEATWTVGDSTTRAGLIVLNDSGELKNADILDYVRKVEVSGDATIDLTNVVTAADNPVQINGLSDSETGTGNLTVQGTTDDYVAINNTVIENAEYPDETAYVADYTGKLILKDVNADLALEDVTVDATTADTTITGSIEGGSLTVYQDSTAQVGEAGLALTDTTLNVVIPKDFVAADGVIKIDQETLSDLEKAIADLGGNVDGDIVYAEDVEVKIGTLNNEGVLIESLGYGKYFDLNTLRVESNGVVLADRNTSYYSDSLTTAETSKNGAAGLTLADAALLNLNPQGDAVTGDLAAVLDQLDRMVAAGDTKGADELGANLAGASTAVLGMAAMGDVDRQLRAIRNRTTTMGVDQTVVNHDMPYFNAWINAEGDQREMKDDGTLGGYKYNSWGGTVGFDVDIEPTFTAGLALTAMYGDLDVTGADKATGSMDTYYVSAFARYCASAWTHTFVATAGMGDISLDRTVNGTTIEGETNSTSFGLMYEVGRVFALDEDATACIQPVFNVAWRHASVDGYTEKGSDAALEVGEQTLNTVTFGLGARLQAVVGESMYNRTSIFECRLLAKADVGDRESAADVALAGGKAEVKSAETGAFGLEAGAGLTIPLGDEGSSIFMDASVELRADYTNVNGTVGYRINF